MKSIDSIIKIVLAVLLVGCLFDVPYGYFQIIRFLGMICFGVLAYNQYQKSQGWFIIWLSSAILINPIFKISLGREVWNIVDIVWATLLIVSIFLKLKTKKT